MSLMSYSFKRWRLPALFLLGGLGLALTSACPGSSSKPEVEGQTSAPSAPVKLSVVGTNDLHGHIEMLPLFGGYLNALRAQEGRELLLLDGGDMFQGTLESNLVEGATIVEAYNLLGYDAAAIGNHEFDFGPVGPDSSVQEEGQDARGALKARAAEANFPFLAANILNGETRAPVDWPNVQPSILVERGGIKIGVIGLSTFETPNVTLPMNFLGLAMAPLAAAINQEAQKLRHKGASVVIVTAHAGGECEDFEDPKDLSSCKVPHEIFEVAEALPSNTVDLIVAGHTHRAVAHEVNGIAIIESYAKGRAFGRIDLEIDGDEVRIERIHPPRDICYEGRGAECEPGEYEGVAVEPDPKVAEVAAKAAAFANDIRQRELGITAEATIERSRDQASDLGNLVVDLMHAAMPKADLALTNGGGLRANIPAGPITYGDLFEALPFDNRFALVTMKGKTLRALFRTNLQRDNGILSVSGISVAASCKGNQLNVVLTRPKGKVISDEESVLVATSDFVASGGDGLLGSPGLEVEKTEIDGGDLIRDAVAAQLTALGPTLPAKDPARFSADHPRIQYPGERPVHCN